MVSDPVLICVFSRYHLYNQAFSGWQQYVRLREEKRRMLKKAESYGKDIVFSDVFCVSQPKLASIKSFMLKRCTNARICARLGLLGTLFQVNSVLKCSLL